MPITGLLTTQQLTLAPEAFNEADSPSGTFAATRLTVTDTSPAITGGKVSLVEGATTEEVRIIRVASATQVIVEELDETFTIAANVTFMGASNPGTPTGSVLAKNSTGVQLFGSKNKAETFWNNLAKDMNNVAVFVSDSVDTLTDFVNDEVADLTAYVNNQVSLLTTYINDQVTALQNSVNTAIENAAVPGGFVTGPAPVWTSGSSITLPANLAAKNTAHTVLIKLTTGIIMNITTVGVNGLDTGTVAANNKYFLYLIKKTSDGSVGAVFSLVNEHKTGSITFPAGGWDQKIQLPLMVVTDSATSIMDFTICEWGLFPTVIYDVGIPAAITSTNSTQITRLGTFATINAYQIQSASAFVPSFSNNFIMKFVANPGASTENSNLYAVRKKGNNTIGNSFNTGRLVAQDINVTTDDNQEFEVARTFAGNNSLANDVAMYVLKYQVTKKVS